MLRTKPFDLLLAAVRPAPRYKTEFNRLKLSKNQLTNHDFLDVHANLKGFSLGTMLLVN